MFVVLLKYIVPLEVIDAQRADHLNFLDRCYSEGIFIVSGMQVPRTGGVIIAKCYSKEYLEKILKADPFYINNLAQYEIIEFSPTRYADSIVLLLTKDIRCTAG